MPHFKAVATIKMTTGIPEDDAENVWHFQGLVDEDTYSDIEIALVNFYDTMRLEFSGKVAQTGHDITIYNMADTPPRAPVFQNTFALTSAPSGGPQASEVALCLSFQGVRISGEPQRNRRGRIYFGPLDTTVVDSDGRPASAFVTKLAGAGEGIIDDLATAAHGTLWVVYSTVTGDLVPVTNGWVDNAFDIQRRRGLAPTSRTTFEV